MDSFAATASIIYNVIILPSEKGCLGFIHLDPPLSGERLDFGRFWLSGGWFLLRQPPAMPGKARPTFTPNARRLRPASLKPVFLGAFPVESPAGAFLPGACIIYNVIILPLEKGSLGYRWLLLVTFTYRFIFGGFLESAVRLFRFSREWAALVSCVLTSINLH